MNEERTIGHHFEQDLFVFPKASGKAGIFPAFCAAKGLFDPSGYLNHVGVRFLEDVNLNTFKAIGAGQHFLVFLAIGNPSHILETDFLAVPATDHGVSNLIQVLIFVDRSDHVFRFTLSNTSTGRIDILSTQSGNHLIHGKIGPLQFCGIHQNVDFFLQPSSDPDGSHTLYRFKAALDLELGEAPKAASVRFPGRGIHFTRRHIRRLAKGETQLHDRVQRRIIMQKKWLLRATRQANRIELFQGILNGVGHGTSPGEFQDHITYPRPTDTTDLAQATDHPQLFLNASADVVFNFLGSGTRILGAHRQGGIAHIRHESHRKLTKRKVTEHHQRYKNHQDGHWAIRREIALTIRSVHKKCEGKPSDPSVGLLLNRCWIHRCIGGVFSFSLPQGDLILQTCLPCHDNPISLFEATCGLDVSFVDIERFERLALGT